MAILVGGIADLGGAAAHQHDGLVAGLLQTPQHHDLDQVADMQAGGGGVEPDVGGDHAGRRRRVQLHRVGDLVDVAARLHGAQEFGLEGGIGHLGILGLERQRSSIAPAGEGRREGSSAC